MLQIPSADPQTIGELIALAHAKLHEGLTDGLSVDELSAAIDAYDTLVRLYRDLSVDPGTILGKGSNGGLIVSSQEFARQVAEEQAKLHKLGVTTPGVTTKTEADLAQETAQVVICAMALAEAAGFDLDAEIAAEWERARVRFGQERPEVSE